MEPAGVTGEELAALHRYYIWQNRQRVSFDALIERAAAGESVGMGDALGIELWAAMSYWYSGLFVVIEGWRSTRLADPEVDELLESPNVDLLQRYRNGTFHFQRRYFDDRFNDLLRDGENVVPWVRALNSALGRFFLEEFERRGVVAGTE